MQRLFAAVLAVACVVGSTPGFALDPTTQLGAPAPQPPTFANPIPAPLPPPDQAPTINGPVSQPALRGMTGIGQQ